MSISCKPATASAINIKAAKPIAHNTHTLTFLKSNYKYKRRCAPTNAPPRYAHVVRRSATHGHNESHAGNCTNVDRSVHGESAENNRIVCKIIFRIFILFIGYLMPLKMAKRAISGTIWRDGDCRQSVRRTAAAAVYDDVCVDSAEMNHQRNYDKVSTRRCQKAAVCHQQPACNNDNNGRLSRDLSSSSSWMLSALTWRHLHALLDGVGRANIGLSTLAVLFMALSLNVRNVNAGECWRASKENGRCSEIYLLNSTKSECCKYPELFYTEREVSSVELFFARSIGNGVECAPCIESCRNVQCGLHKKCVKRKGRPKCICAPECGAAARRRRYERKLFRGHEHHNEQLRPNAAPRELDVASVNFEAKSPRDIRSLSSEITNINLGVRHQTQNQNPSQRKMIILQSQSQQKPQARKKEPKPERLLITANVEQTEKPTARRLQILSNVRVHNRNRKVGVTDAGGDGSGGSGGGNDRRNNNDSSSTVLETRRGSNTSRHKANNNSNNNHNSNRKQHTTELQQEDATLNNNSGNRNYARHRQTHAHTHAQARALENAPNHDEVLAVDSQHHERHQQLHRKRKHHHRSKHKRLKDHNANNAHTRTATSMTSQSAMSALQHNATATNTMATTTTITLQPTTTPVNSTALLLPSHGSKTAASVPSSASPTQPHAQWHSHSPTSSTAFFGGGVVAATVNRNDGSKSSVNPADDLTLLDGIYDNYNTYGFPNRQQEFTHYEQAPHPVCGTDGRTYNTECQLKKRACRTNNPTLSVAYRGHCRTTCNGVKCLNGLTCVEDHYTIPHCIDCKIDCPQDDRSVVIDPSRAVCGVDGKTYRSICDINRMICKIGRSIAVAYLGPCREDRVTCNEINCGSRYTCLMDLLTHEPRCVSCQYKCARKRRPASLRFEEGKICGVNNRTYNSWCEMRKDSCSTGFFIDVKSAGACQ